MLRCHLFQRAPHRLLERFTEVVHTVGNGLHLFRVVDERVVDEGGLGDVTGKRIPFLAKGQIVEVTPCNPKTTMVAYLEFPD